MKNVIVWVLAVFILLPSLSQAHDEVNLQQPSPAISSLSWSPDGKKIAASFNDMTVKVWGLNADGSQLITPPLLTFKPELVDSIKWTPDSKYLVSQGERLVAENGLFQSNVAKWDAQTGHFIENLFDYRMETPYKFNTVTYYPNLAISFDKTFDQSAFSLNSRMITLSDIAPVLFVKSGIVKHITWSPDGTRLAVFALTDFEGRLYIQTFDVDSGNLLNTILETRWISDMVWSPDNLYLAVFDKNSGDFCVYGLLSETDPVSCVSFKLAAHQKWPEKIQRVISWHPKENILAISFSKFVNFYALPIEDPIATIQTKEIVLLDWSPDGKHLAGSNPEGEISIWDVSNLGK